MGEVSFLWSTLAGRPGSVLRATLRWRWREVETQPTLVVKAALAAGRLEASMLLAARPVAVLAAHLLPCPARVAHGGEGGEGREALTEVEPSSRPVWLWTRESKGDPIPAGWLARRTPRRSS